MVAASLAMYTPWPFSDLFQELGDKVEVFDFSKYNFVTPIMKPDAMDGATLLDRVMANYRRFYMRKSFLGYPFERDKAKRRYLLGCLKAFLKSGFQRTFTTRQGRYWGRRQKSGLPTSRTRPWKTRGRAPHTAMWKTCTGRGELRGECRGSSAPAPRLRGGRSQLPEASSRMDGGIHPGGRIGPTHHQDAEAGRGAAGRCGHGVRRGGIAAMPNPAGRMSGARSPS